MSLVEKQAEQDLKIISLSKQIKLEEANVEEITKNK